MKIIVTGSEGNIGRKLVPYLRGKGHRVLRCDIAQEYADDYVKSDITNPVELYIAAHKFKPDYIYHLAGMVSRVTCEAAPALTVSTNVTGTANIISLCKMMDAALINFSTSEVYGNIDGMMIETRKDLEPNNIYGISKLMAERLVEYADLRMAVTVRLFMIYDEDETMGGHRSAMIRFAEALIRKKPIKAHRASSRSWLYIDDCVEALHSLMSLKEYKVINLGHPEQTTAVGLATKMCLALELNPHQYIEEVGFPEKMTLNKRPSLERQSELLNFEPKIPLYEGVRRLIEKVKERLK